MSSVLDENDENYLDEGDTGESTLLERVGIDCFHFAICFQFLAGQGQPESGELIPSGSDKLESGELTPSLCFDKGLVFVESGKGHTDLDCFTFNLAYYV